MTEDELKTLHEKCSDNRAALESSKHAACFFCCSRFDANTIVEWVGKRDRALCPRCGIDSVIPDDGSITDEMLTAMEGHWFGLRSGRLIKQARKGGAKP